MTSVKIWVGSLLLNIWALLDKATITFTLGTISTLLVIAYHIIKIRKEVNNKKD